MNKKIVGLISIILSVFILIYFESSLYKIVGAIGINLRNYSSLIQSIINIVVKLIMCFIIYLIYKRDFKKRYGKDNFIKKILFFCLYLVLLIILMYGFKYVIGFLGDIFNINIIQREFYNIFNKTLNIELVLKILSDYVIIPFLYCVVILLGTDKLFKHNRTFIIVSGLISAIIYGVGLNGTLGYVILNSLYMFIMFSFLGYIYKRENSIWMIIMLYSIFLISEDIIINFLRW